MKKYTYYILFFLSLFLTSCEEVVELDLKTAPEKLVIDANLYYDNPNTTQVIKLSKTTAFYDTNVNPYLDAQVWIENNIGQQFDFIDNDLDGNYQCNSFVMNLNSTYTLYVIAEGQTYTATEIFYNTPVITQIDQKNDGGFLGKSYEFKIWFQDNALQENYYQLIDNISGKREFDVKDDTYSNGNLMNFTVSDPDIEIGDNFNISFSEVSKDYYLYMQKILSISQGASNPFASPIGEIRGNIINQTSDENYPLGFFSLHKTRNRTLVVE